MKLSQWAKQNGLQYHTAWRLFRNGNLPVKAIQLKTGTILVSEPIAESRISNDTVVYCRVSNHSRKKELAYQVSRCEEFCFNNGWSVSHVYKEIASGLNDNRKQFWRTIEAKPSRIVIEHKDRLTRFGFRYLEKLLLERGCEIVVINRDKEDEADLIKDMASVIYSFCARLYGMRRAYNKSRKIKAIVDSPND